MKFFFDYEFHEHFVGTVLPKLTYHTIEPMQFGMICENGRSLDLLYNDFDTTAAWNNEWLRENVIKRWFHHKDESMFTLDWFEDYIAIHGISKADVANLIKEFVAINSVNELPEFYAYFADYDWICFCQTFGRMISLPESWPMYCRDLKQTLDEKVELLFKRNDVIVNEESIEVMEKTMQHYMKAVKSMRSYPKQNDEHDALADAKWNFELFKFLQTL